MRSRDWAGLFILVLAAVMVVGGALRAGPPMFGHGDHARVTPGLLWIGAGLVVGLIGLVVVGILTAVADLNYEHSVHVIQYRAGTPGVAKPPLYAPAAGTAIAIMVLVLVGAGAAFVGAIDVHNHPRNDALDTYQPPPKAAPERFPAYNYSGNMTVVATANVQQNYTTRTPTVNPSFAVPANATAVHIRLTYGKDASESAKNFKLVLSGQMAATNKKYSVVTQKQGPSSLEVGWQGAMGTRHMRWDFYPADNVAFQNTPWKVEVWFT